ncbi:lipoprotein [Kitasatospora xanthocidica]|uniref:GerMN domain-containing protein n=1 Tax=Kitasatospora xanthocidica TaxID=83382 RepID=UPI00167BA162|nr:GerMN domain-containing protein [Kitasatospora xanthocidica]GHF91211.1 lipoprotein [Kitasatospora xanthocidica]
MTVRHRLVPVTAALLLACGCSIATTDPVKSGRAATGVQPGTRLYFLDQHGLRLTIRPGAQRDGLQRTLDALVAGPDRAEAHTGLYSELPAGGRVQATAVPGTVTLRLSWPAASLSASAVQQLVCTADDAPAESGPPPRVTIVSSDGPSAIQQQCDLHRDG